MALLALLIGLLLGAQGILGIAVPEVFPMGLPNSRIALPLNLCLPASLNINIERAIVTDSVFLAIHGNSVVPGRERNPKPSLIVGGE